jgi:hypothetical protein
MSNYNRTNLNTWVFNGGSGFSNLNSFDTAWHGYGNYDPQSALDEIKTSIDSLPDDDVKEGK